MKERFTTVDLMSILFELRERLTGMRLQNVYDIDSRTYLLKFSRSEEKATLLFQSGARIHLTEFDWPKNSHPSGFSMKCRKHLRNKRLVSISQLGVDRVVDLEFGSGEACYHLLVEVYDRGNVLLTDGGYSIQHLLRSRTDAGTEVRLASGQIYRTDLVRQHAPPPDCHRLTEVLSGADLTQPLSRILAGCSDFGHVLIGHCLMELGFELGVKVGQGFQLETDMDRLVSAVALCDSIFKGVRSGCPKPLVLHQEEKVATLQGPALVSRNLEFHPMLYNQHKTKPFREFPSMNKAVDEFFSSLESQKIDQKTTKIEKQAVKKLDNVEKDHRKRIDRLREVQGEDQSKARIIELNIDLVTRACSVVCRNVAAGLPWETIEAMLRDGKVINEPVAMAIHQLKLKEGLMTMALSDPYEQEGSDKACLVDIDLEISAYANAKRYYVHKKRAADKEQKTVGASEMALKSAKKKAKQTVREAAKISTIQKARKTYWFEKFIWCISSENYLIIGGRDQQQNELIVKKYLLESDVYVHADLHGASSVVVKNPGGGAVPPLTLQEAGCMAVCYSAAWAAHVLSDAWWVYSHQVSKSAPTGEYLPTGSFMVRGRKNYLPPSQLVLGFAFLFKLEESSVQQHLGERRVRGLQSQPSLDDDGPEEEVVAVDSEDGEEDTDLPDTTASYPDTTISYPDTTISYPDTTVSYPDVKDSQAIFMVGSGLSNDPHTTSLNKRVERKGAQPSQPPPQLQPAASNSSAGAGSVAVKSKKKSKPGQGFSGLLDARERTIQRELLGLNQTKAEDKMVKSKKKSSNSKKKYREATSKNFVPSRRRQADPRVLLGEEQGDVPEEQGDVPEEQGDVPEEQGDVPDEQGDVPEEQGDVPEEQGDVPEEQGDVIEEQGDVPDEQIVQQKDKNGVQQIEVRIQQEEDRVQQEEDRVQQEEDRAQQEEDRVQQEEDRVQQEEDRVQQEEDRVQQEEDKVQQEEDRVQLEEEVKATDEDIAEMAKEVVSVLDGLTGSPLPEDELLFAVPVCAPYSALTSYKYRVKLIPGLGRRGKAARSAVLHFTQVRDIPSREKDLIKSVKDTDLSRYFPGKVKMSYQTGSAMQKRK